LNVKRRNLNKGQVAIAAAESVLINQQSQRQAATMFGVDNSYVSRAADLLAEAPKAAASVKAGHVSLTAAYEALREAQAQRENAEQQTLDLERELGEQRAEEATSAPLTPEPAPPPPPLADVRSETRAAWRKLPALAETAKSPTGDRPKRLERTAPA
jgi:DNA-binding transcriptional MocR family regulator